MCTIALPRPRDRHRYTAGLLGLGRGAGVGEEGEEEGEEAGEVAGVGL